MNAHRKSVKPGVVFVALAAAFVTGGQAQYAFTNLAGRPGGAGNIDGPGAGARFNWPSGLAIDHNRNIYVADTSNQKIRKITSEGVVSTMVGSAAGLSPSGLAIDGAGILYVTDGTTIRKVSPAGQLTTLAGRAGYYGSSDGPGGTARFMGAVGVAVDSGGNAYVADSGNYTLRKISPSGNVTTLAGSAGQPGSADGLGSAARFGSPWAVAVDESGNVYVADNANSTIRKVSPAGLVTTLAGTSGLPGLEDGPPGTSRLYSPTALSLGSEGILYVADANRIRKVDTNGTVTTLAGDLSGSADGVGKLARFSEPRGIAVDSSGVVYIADTMNCTIRKLDTGGVVSTIAGSVGHGGYDDGTGITARFTYPTSGTIAPSTNLYLLDGLGAIRKVTPAGQVTTLAGSGKVSGSSDGVGYAAQFNRPLAITVSPAGDLYVADTGNNTVRKVTTTGVVSTFAGDPNSFGTADGTGNNARFYGPSGIASDSEGNLYVADAYNYTLRKVSPNRAVSTLAGKAGVSGSSDGTGSAARFGQLAGLAVGPAGTLYAADAGNHTIRKVSPTGVVTTLAGSAGRPGSTDGQGSIARFNRPTSLATDGAGNIYVADTDNCLVRMISPTGKVATLGGRPGWVGGRDGVGRDALFASPSGIAVDPSGNLLVVDAWNNSVSRGVLIPQPTLLLSWSNGLAHLRVAGMPGTTYRWEYTASLDPGGTWQTLSGQTNWFLTNSPALFIDSSASPNEPRFYRMRLVLP